MEKIFHSLRFQLPAVALSVFIGILFLLMLFFHEMTHIVVKTKQLAQSAEVSDHVGNWLNDISSSARDRTKLMSLGNEIYLRNLQVTLQGINTLYSDIEKVEAAPNIESSLQLSELHKKQLEYSELLDGFAKDHPKNSQQNLALLLPEEKKLKTPSKPILKSAAKKLSKKSPKKVLKKPGKTSSKPLAKKPSKIKNKIATKITKKESFHLEADPVKEIEVDTATNETFKAYEQSIREGLLQTQETIRSERTDKLQSLRNSISRAKDRLIYSLLLLLAIAGYMAFVIKWKILDPMAVLKTGVVAIGKGSLGYQVEIRSKNEMGELAEVFNRMSIELDQKQNSELRLKRLEAIEQIVRSVNHEINNPLMIISGNAEYLLAVLENSDPFIKSKLNYIIDEVRRIFIVTQRLKEIKEPISESYIGGKEEMIDLARSSQIIKRDF